MADLRLVLTNILATEQLIIMEHANIFAFIRIKHFKDHFCNQTYQGGSIFIILATSERVEKNQPYDTSSYYLLKVYELGTIQLKMYCIN